MRQIKIIGSGNYVMIYKIFTNGFDRIIVKVTMYNNLIRKKFA